MKIAKYQDYIVAPNDLNSLEPRCIHISTCLIYLVTVACDISALEVFSPGLGKDAVNGLKHRDLMK